MNALEKVVDLLVMIIILFMIPLLYYSGGEQITEAMLAGQIGENFLKRVSTAGKITLPVWTELENTLAEVGVTGFSLRQERRLIEPIDENGTLAECVYTKDERELQKQISETGDFFLQNGDRLWLTLYVNEIPTVYYESVRTGVEYP